MYSLWGSESSKNVNIMIIVFILLLITECIRSLKLVELRVPGHVTFGSRVELTCTWVLGPTDLLYSVKWYKDGKEFFRHVPGDLEPKRNFSLPGVRVVDSDPSGAKITLSSASLETSGRYRCEVSGEKPLFVTVSELAELQVIVLPERGPAIFGFRSRYKIGDRVLATCVSGRSYPATELVWYTNGEPAPSRAVKDLQYTKHDDGLIVTKLSLEFIVSEEHFEDNRLRIKCLVTLSPFYWKSNEEIALRERNFYYKELEIRSTEKISQRLRTERANQHNAATRKTNLNELITIVLLYFLVR